VSPFVILVSFCENVSLSRLSYISRFLLSSRSSSENSPEFAPHSRPFAVQNSVSRCLPWLECIGSNHSLWHNLCLLIDHGSEPELGCASGQAQSIHALEPRTLSPLRRPAAAAPAGRLTAPAKPSGTWNSASASCEHHFSLCLASSHSQSASIALFLTRSHSFSLVLADSRPLSSP